MKNIKLFIFLVSFGLISSYTFSEEGEEEAGEGDEDSGEVASEDTESAEESGE